MASAPTDRAEWDVRARWVVAEVLPVRDLLTGDAILGDELGRYPDDPTCIRLRPEQVAELARFLRGAPAA